MNAIDAMRLLSMAIRFPNLDLAGCRLAGQFTKYRPGWLALPFRSAENTASRRQRMAPAHRPEVESDRIGDLGEFLNSADFRHFLSDSVFP
jgi:hypothetical protein